MKVRNIPRKFMIAALIVGASLISGLLSFGGMYAIWPLISLAAASFGLSVAFEGELFNQNLNEVWKRIFKPYKAEQELAKEILRAQCPRPDALNSQDYPQFFVDYKRQLDLLEDYEDKRLDAASEKDKKAIEKTLTDMEKWFAKQLFKRNTDNPAPYEAEIHGWLDALEDAPGKRNLQGIQDELARRKQGAGWAKVFTAVAGLFSTISTTFLLTEAIGFMPIVTTIISATALPWVILSLSVVSGLSFALLTYNASINLIAHNPITERAPGNAEKT